MNTELLKELHSMLAGPRFCAKELTQLLAGCVDEVTEDHNGNIICHKPGNGKKWMIRTVIGSSGLMVYHIDEKDRAYFNLLGDVSFAEMNGAMVTFENGERKTVLAKEDSAERLIDLYIPAEDGSVKIGDVATFCPKRESVWTEEGLCAAWDRMEACALAMLQLLSRCTDTAADLTLVFSAKAYDQFRGAMPVFMERRPDTVVFLSEQPSADGSEELRLMCNSPVCVYNAGELRATETLAERLGVGMKKCVREMKPNPTENDLDPSILALSCGAQVIDLALPVQLAEDGKMIGAKAVEQLAVFLEGVVRDA